MNNKAVNLQLSRGKKKSTVTVDKDKHYNMERPITVGACTKIRTTMHPT